MWTERFSELIEKQMVLTLMRQDKSTDLQMVYKNSVMAAKACKEIRKIFDDEKEIDMSSFEPKMGTNQPLKNTPPSGGFQPVGQPQKEPQTEPQTEPPVAKREPEFPPVDVPDYRQQQGWFPPQPQVGYPQQGQPQGYPTGQPQQGYPQGQPQQGCPTGQPPQGYHYPQNQQPQGYPPQGHPQERQDIQVELGGMVQTLNIVSENITEIQSVTFKQIQEMQTQILMMRQRLYELMGR